MVAPPSKAPAEALEAEEPEATPEPWNAVPEARVALVDASLHGTRLDKAVVALAPEFSRNHLQSLIEEGHVRLDGEIEPSPSRKVRAGQRLEIVLVPTAESRAFRPEPMALPIVFEDAHLLIVDKPAGLVVHPAAGNWNGTLLNGLLAHSKAAATLPRAGIVHRLDKDTSGLMVVGKTLAAVTALSRDIAARRVQRFYLAIVHGEAREDAFSIEAPIGRDPQARVKMAVIASGKPARTDIRCVHRAGGHSILRCTLHTGRTHQIRVHLASHGYPLVADAVYGGKPALGMQRQALHAVQLGFVHPIAARPVSFDAPPPADLQAALRLLGGTPATG